MIFVKTYGIIFLKRKEGTHELTRSLSSSRFSSGTSWR
nr:MAG TPA: hypothetical protein [Caudoviricetes sp.]